MAFKSYAKINLSLSVNKKNSRGLHDIQSVYCLIDLYDKIQIKKSAKQTIDKISISGPYSRHVNKLNNSVIKCLNLLRKYKLVSNYYSIKIQKNIPVFAGFGGGSSNAAKVLSVLIKKNVKKNILNSIYNEMGSDVRLFTYNRGYLKNLKTIKKIRNKYKFYFLFVYPNIRCSTKEVYSKVENYSKKKEFFTQKFRTKNGFLNHLKDGKNDLQAIVEKKYPLIRKLLLDISKFKGCYFSRMTGSGSACYGIFFNKKCSKAALKKLRKRYPKFLISIAKTI